MKSSTRKSPCFWISGRAGAALAARRCPPVLEEIADERKDIKVGKVNVDEEGELAAQFGIMSIPTLVVMKGGKITGQAVGARPKAQILGLL